MFVIDPDRLWESAGLRRDRIIQPIIRKALALSKSLGPILYLVSVGVIAIWVIGVFFGLGFFFLMHHHSEKEASHLGIGNAHLSASLVESPWVFQSMIRLDRLFPQPSEVELGDRDLTIPAPDKKSAVYIDRQVVARAEPVADQSATELEGRPLSADLGITPPVLGELSPVSPPSQPLDVIGLRSAAQSPQAASPHKPHQARPTNDRSIHTTAGVCDRCTEPSHRATHRTGRAKAKRSAFWLTSSRRPVV
jgi:hypothetical protein